MKMIGYVLMRRADGSEFVCDIADIQYQDKDCTEVERNPKIHGALLADHLDDELENANYHSLVGMYRKIYTVFVGVAGIEQADQIMEEIAELNLF